MSRLNDLVNRIELLAKKFEMSIEDVVSILEGKHPHHMVVSRPANPTQAANTTNPPTVDAATSNSTGQMAGTASTASAPTAGIASTNNAENPTGSGDAAASAGTVGQQAAGSTESAGVDSGNATGHNED